MVDIGGKLKFAREAIGYTLDKVEKETGIGKSSLSEFENNKREPKFSQLSRLAQIYRRAVDFFLTAEPVPTEVMFWREPSVSSEEKQDVESKFRQLCEQYHNLEMCTAEAKKTELPEPDIDKPQEFGYPQAESFAGKVQKEFCLGDIPSASLKRKLEETYFVKIFHLVFSGSAVSTVSDFGPAILLNAQSKSWRCNFDLAHELFHILTWRIFRSRFPDETVCSEDEDKLANVFASRLLMPESSLDKVRDIMNKQGEISFNQLEDIARELDVSLDALVCRLAGIYRFKKEDTERYRNIAKTYIRQSPEETPPQLPERYCDLAVRALREGKLSLTQFAKCMGISYKKAQEYLTSEEGFTNEKISIPVA